MKFSVDTGTNSGRDPGKPLQNRKGSGALGFLAPGNTMLSVNSLESKKREQTPREPSGFTLPWPRPSRGTGALFPASTS